MEKDFSGGDIVRQLGAVDEPEYGTTVGFNVQKQWSKNVGAGPLGAAPATLPPRSATGPPASRQALRSPCSTFFQRARGGLLRQAHAAGPTGAGGGGPALAWGGGGGSAAQHALSCGASGPEKMHLWGAVALQEAGAASCIRAEDCVVGLGMKKRGGVKESAAPSPVSAWWCW